MLTPVQLLGLAAAGAAGTLARYGLSVLIDGRAAFAGQYKLYGTLVVNAVGCLLFGVALAWFDARVLHAEHPTRLIVLTGFMGAFTTFSTFAYLTSDLAAKGQWLTAGGHVLAHNVIGIALFVVGATVGARLAG